MTRELPITGYLDRLSHRPGERFSAHVSLAQPGPFHVRLQRVVCADPNPAGPGMDLRDLSHVFATTCEGPSQPIRLGSYATAPAPARDSAAPCTWSILVWMAGQRPTHAILAEAAGPASLTLLAGTDGPVAELRDADRLLTLTGQRLAPRRWHRLTVTLADGHATLTQTTLDDASEHRTTIPTQFTLPASGSITFAADSTRSRLFTGKLEAPSITSGTQTLAAWNFAHGIDSTTLHDTGPQALHGQTHGMPNRGMVGAHWTGREHCWRHAPADYAAIHFHDGDLEDCGWSETFGWTVPEDLPSGAYALHLTCPGGEDWLPLYILPKRQGPHAKLAFLASTFTYQAYFNHARGNADATYLSRAEQWGAYPHNPDHYPLYGRSTYNKHADGSGIAFSSRHRPTLTMRPGFLTFDDPKGSGLRHYPADSHLLAWLEAQQIPFDIITDEDLDEEGEALLRPYACVLTGSHPEYHTENTLDALHSYTRSGGRLCYLGGNGFYWRIARSPGRPHLIELRRAEGGIRAWAAEPGEYHHQSDGQMGGLWRRNRRPPQLLAGVGFSGQGKFEGTHYRRLAPSYTPDYAWMFAGITEETIGDYGLSGGGAAGFELDRADPALGTPENTVILAVSEDPPASFVTVPEELLSHLSTVTGESPDALKRGEIIHFDLPGGGAVFAVGSITFCGSLWHEGTFQGPISRLLENVVRRFMGP